MSTLRGGEEGNAWVLHGELAGARTQDPRLKRALLYQLSYELTGIPATSKLTQKSQPEWLQGRILLVDAEWRLSRPGRPTVSPDFPEGLKVA